MDPEVLRYVPPKERLGMLAQMIEHLDGWRYELKLKRNHYEAEMLKAMEETGCTGYTSQRGFQYEKGEKEYTIKQKGLIKSDTLKGNS